MSNTTLDYGYSYKSYDVLMKGFFDFVAFVHYTITNICHYYLANTFFITFVNYLKIV